MPASSPTMMNTGFVPADLDGASWSAVEPLVRALLAREVASPEAFESWLHDRSELEAACSESAAILYIAMTCHTHDEAKQGAYTAYISEVAPELKRAGFRLDERQVELADRFPLPAARFGVLDRDTRAEVELFREENVPLQTELDKLSQKYDQIAGAMTVEFDGQERTLPQMGRYQESTDRELRERAWRAVTDRRLQEREAIDAVFDEMIGLRHKVAQNAGFADYVGYAFRARRRFDYTPADCVAFHDAVAELVVPVVRDLDASRVSSLGVDRLRPWDLSVDVKGRSALEPFEDGKDLVTRTTRALERLDPRLAAMFRTLGDGSGSQGAEGGACLDLDSRRGKAPGGYQYNRDRSRVPFIFMNAAGLHRDVETMVHEAGHAFHSMLAKEEPLLHYRHSPIEFAEVASMTMELLTMPYWDEYYNDPESLARAQRKQLEGAVGLLPWIATIDAYQHWLYANPGHTRAERTAHWLGLDGRFGHTVDWSTIEPARETQWQRQGHLFGSPFYYIEYGIAQLGALGLWLHSLEHGEASAIDRYMAALRLGGSKPLPELFEAAGLPFDFGKATIARLAERVADELAKLPA
ncbi:MAG: M3 family oligoendopeptidase [Phycisphaerales bacterium]|nr:MAG: M3 family oligoendopeptidase [Phycisphaerales bacterium]